MTKKNKIRVPNLPKTTSAVCYLLLFSLIAFFLMLPELRGYAFGLSALLLMYYAIQKVADREFRTEIRNQISGDMVETITDLSPKGKIKYSGEVVDAVSESERRIESGTVCEVVDLHKGHYVVRPKAHEQT